MIPNEKVGLIKINIQKDQPPLANAAYEVNNLR
jgi:hypothetical protein